MDLFDDRRSQKGRRDHRRCLLNPVVTPFLGDGEFGSSGESKDYFLSLSSRPGEYLLDVNLLLILSRNPRLLSTTSFANSLISA